MVDERPSKKLRTQSNAPGPNARASIARANNTYVQQQPLRRDNWNSARGTASAIATAPAGLDLYGQDQGQERSSGSGYDNGLVQYESPTIVDNSSMPTNHTSQAASGASFADAANTTLRTLPSLPSPAPSDENIQSPVIAEGQLGHMGARRGRKMGAARGRTPADGAASHVPTLSTTGSASASPLSAQSPTFPLYTHQQFTQMGLAPSPYQQGIQPHPYSPDRRQSQQQGHQQTQFQQQVPWQGMRQGSLSRLNSINSPTNMSGASPQPLRSPVPVPSNNKGRPVAMQMHAPASRRPNQELLAEISQRETSLSQAGRLSPTNNGRLLLLRDAVEKGDWFYLILSQLFCLRSIAPDTLPQSISGVGSKCFDMLDALLCSNRDVDPELLRFFSRFPEPIMNIYSHATGDARDQYEARLRMVKDFLIKLPMHWDGLVHRCQALQSPPLVQDMIETLGLESVILQATAFRAIARMFGGSLGETKCIRALEQLHRIDQETYYRQAWRRTQAEKTECYQHYRYTLQSWSQATEQQKANFTAPAEVLQYFKRCPQSTANALQQQHQLHQRQVAQAQAQANMQPLSPTLQNQHHMQMQMQMQMNAQAQAQSAHRAHSNTPQLPVAPPPHQMLPVGLRQQAFFPRPESQPRAQPTHPDPNRSALHQAHLRSPVLGPINPEPGAMRMYRHVVGYGVPPTKLKRAAAVQHVTFTVSEATWERLAKNEPPLNNGEPPRRTLTEQSLNFRLRCCTCPANGFATESSWVTADNYWPEELSFRLNGKALETRRKLHFGRYLPIDVTEFLCVGTNTLQIIINRMDRDLRKTNFAVAVEAIGVMEHDTIKNNIKRITAAESRESIKKSLSGEDCGDDDIAVTSSSMTIKLTDPYSGCNMVNIPVRGTACLHHDCFDLEVFLGLCRRPHEGWPTVVDCWRCPLCRSDVRPQMLIVDEFLLEVRESLAKQDSLDTRAIVVETDGTWRVKEEEKKGVRSPSLEREERRMQSMASAVAAPKKAIEIIDLDD